MAKRASAGQVNADMAPADFRYAVQMVRGDVEKKKDKISSLNGEIADVYAKIEGKGVNRKAAKIFAALDKLEHDERLDVMRSLNGLLDAAGYPEEEGDLADQAEGNVVPMRVGDKPDLKKQAALEAEKKGTAADPGFTDPPAAKLSGADALAKTKAKFANGGKEEVDNSDAYQGDDDDLADDDEDADVDDDDTDVDD